MLCVPSKGSDCADGDHFTVAIDAGAYTSRVYRYSQLMAEEILMVSLTQLWMAAVAGVDG